MSQRLTPSLCIHALTGLRGLFFPFYCPDPTLCLSLWVWRHSFVVGVCARARVVMSGKSEAAEGGSRDSVHVGISTGDFWNG